MTFEEILANPWYRVSIALYLFAIIVIGIVLLEDAHSRRQAPLHEDLKLKRQAKRMQSLRAKIKRNRMRR